MSYAKPGKLFTAHSKIFLNEEGRLNARKTSEVIDQVIGLFRKT
ncbi:MAG: hypothetical protein NTZ01_05780 [Verrucomicrobia bacterium]|nr:hypothetical protein [Verrucomicrobiota bacterium]